MRSYRKLLLILAMVILAGLMLYQWPPSQQKSASFNKIPRGGDFTLSTANGPFHLRAQRGKVVLIYFGYSFCPDVCPTNLMLMAQALNALDKDELSHVQGVFISVDPERDTMDKLARYTSHFHASIIGATGKPEQIAHIARQYGAAYRKVEGESRAGYLVDHSSNTYVIAPDGSLHSILPHASPAEDILKVTRNLLKQIQEEI